MGFVYSFSSILLQLTDKCEALTHQKLATKMLASKTRELEEKIQEFVRKELDEAEEVKPATVEV